MCTFLRMLAIASIAGRASAATDGIALRPPMGASLENSGGLSAVSWAARRLAVLELIRREHRPDFHAGTTTTSDSDRGRCSSEYGAVVPRWRFRFRVCRCRSEHGACHSGSMQETMDAMVARRLVVDGKPTSLLDLGYSRCGYSR